MVDNLVVGAENTVRQPICHTFSWGLSSGLLEGIATIEMLLGTISFGVRCHPA